MGAAIVNVKEIDLSQRVPSFEGVYGAIVLPSKKGRTDRPVLVTSDTDFLNRYTPDATIKVGYDLSHYSALAYLSKSDKLQVMRVANGATFAGLILKSSTSAYANRQLESGTNLIEASNINFDDLNDAEPVKASIVYQSVTFIAVNSGIIGNNISLVFDGVLDIASVVNAWNLANPENEVSFTGAVGDEVLDAGTAQLAGGLEAVNVEDDALFLYSANQGEWGNAIGVKVYNYLTSPTKVKVEGAFLVEVYKLGTATPVESFLCSRIEGKKDGYGKNIFVDDVLTASAYIRGISNVSIDEAIYPKEQTSILYMNDGQDGLAVSSSNMIAAAQAFSNPEDVQVTLLMDGGFSVAGYQHALNTIAQNRKDCVAILSVPFAAEDNSDYVNAILDYRRTDLNMNSSYAAIYTPHVLVTDRFNDRRIYVAPDGYAAGAISETASNYEAWYPAAGFRRGVLSVEDVRRRFTQGEMDSLYDAGINPIKFFKGRGIIIWGQKTLSAAPSALDRLNVRMLLVVIEPALKKVLENFLFELNDDGTRSIIKALCDSYMDSIQARRGVEDYKVVCDGTNNLPNDIDNNRLNVDIFIRPTRSVEEINLRMIITSSSITFEEAAQAL